MNSRNTHDISVGSQQQSESGGGEEGPPVLAYHQTPEEKEIDKYFAFSNPLSSNGNTLSLEIEFEAWKKYMIGKEASVDNLKNLLTRSERIPKGYGQTLANFLALIEFFGGSIGDGSESTGPFFSEWHALSLISEASLSPSRINSEQLPYWKRLYQIAIDKKDLILKSFKNLLQEALELVSFKKNLKYCEFFLSGTTILNSIFLAVWLSCTLVRHNYLVKEEISTFAGANSTESSEFTTTFKSTNLTRADLLHGMTAAVSVSMPSREPVVMNFLDSLMYLSLIRMLLHGNNVLSIIHIRAFFVCMIINDPYYESIDHQNGGLSKRLKILWPGLEQLAPLRIEKKSTTLVLLQNAIQAIVAFVIFMCLFFCYFKNEVNMENFTMQAFSPGVDDLLGRVIDSFF
ncbi:hypothetical protein CAJCM15448_43720 [Candidozyma auris]|nr:hypothetical protein CAJCM15448_43720 [[Candida] auris]